jgi:hypothetical protein
MSAKGIRAGAAYVEIFADSSKLVRGLSLAAVRLKSFGAQLQAIGSGMQNIGTKIFAVGAGVLAPMVAAAKVFADTGHDLSEMSVRTGVAVGVLSELGAVAQMSGLDMETMEGGLRKMQRTVVNAAKGSPAATDALAALGIAVGQLDGLAPDAMLAVFADKLSRIPDPTIRAAMAMEVFGRGGTKMLPMLAGGAAGLAKMRERMRQLGLTITAEDVTAANAFKEVLKELSLTFKKLLFDIGAALAPILSDLATWITDLVVRASAWVRENQGLVESILKIAAGVAAAGAALVVLGYGVSAIGSVFVGFAAVIVIAKMALMAIGSVLGALLTPLGAVLVAVAVLGGYLLWTSGAGGKALSWLGKRFGDLRGIAETVGQGIVDALSAGDITLAANILWLGLKLAWQTGVTALAAIWYGLKQTMLDMGTNIWAGVQSMWEIGFANLTSVWAETANAYESVWIAAVGIVQLKWIQTIAFLEKAWARLRGVFDKGFDVEGAIDVAETKRRWGVSQVVGKTDSALGESDQRATDRKTWAELTRSASLAKIAKDAAAARRAHAEAANADIARTQGDLDKARADLAAATAKARKERADRDDLAAWMKEEPDAVAKSKYGGLNDLLEETVKRTTGTRVSFNAMEAPGLEWGDATDRLTQAAEATAKNTKKIADQTRDIDLVFD